MTVEEYCQLIRSRWPSANPIEPTAETLSFCDQAVEEHPNAARLWVMRGDLLQLADPTTSYPLSESARSYQRAIAVDPQCAEAYEELGMFLGNVMGKPRKARQYLHKAWLLRRRSRA